MKSIIEQKKDLEEGKVLKVDINWADPFWDLRRKQLVSSLPGNTTKDEIIERTNTLIIKESCFNIAMEHLSKVFAFKISESELKQYKELVESQLRPQYEEFKKTNPKDATEEVYNARVNDIATKTIMRALIFDQIAKIKNISVDDKEVLEAIQDFGKATKTDTDNLQKGEEFEQIKRMVLDNKITNVILDMYKFEPSKPTEQK